MRLLAPRSLAWLAILVSAPLYALPLQRYWVYGQEARLRPSDGGSLDFFGQSVALFGDTIVVGAAQHDVGAAADAGAAYVSVRAAGTWSEQAQLLAADGSAGDAFGASVALDQQTIAIGAPAHDVGAHADAGAVYVFVRSGTSWNLQAKLVSPEALAGDRFGAAVAVQDDWLVAGAPSADLPGGEVDAGAAFVFERSGTSWTFRQKLVASDHQAANRFGTALALDGADLLVGAPGALSTRGAGYVFVAPFPWTEQAKLSSTLASSSASSGTAVDIYRGRALLGAPFDDRPNRTDVGAAFVYLRSATTWSLETKLLLDAGKTGDNLGRSVALWQDEAVLGAPDESSGANGLNAGAAHLFKAQPSWAHVLKLADPSATMQTVRDQLGIAVALEDDTVVAGAWFDNMPGVPAVGSAFVFGVRTIGESFCDASDGALAACPCANPGAPDSGCDNAQATGGVRVSVGEQDLQHDLLYLFAEGFPPSALPGVVVLRSRLIAAQPIVLGDGVLCLSGAVVRVGVGQASQGTFGRTFHNGLGTGTFLYQEWYRNQPDAYCTPAGSNTSNGVVVVW